jgi:hypothetical protein
MDIVVNTVPAAGIPGVGSGRAVTTAAVARPGAVVRA